MHDFIRRALIATCCTTMVCYASLSLASGVREPIETTPPAADGALTPEQTPPMRLPKQVSAPNAASNAEPTVNVSAKPSMPADVIIPPPIVENSAASSVSK